ncbi:MAG: hypothetical protein ACE5IC_06050 [Candidatus Brocadiales bacterium]
MFRFVKILTCYLILSTFLTPQAESIQLRLTEKDIGDALEYGTARRDLTHPELLRDWRVDLGYGVGSATIITPFGSIAVLAKEMARRFRDPTDREIREEIDKKKGKLVFGCSVYGDSQWFADDYKAFLMYKDKKLEPSETEIPTSAKYTRSYPDSPRYWALCFFTFAILDIDPDAKITLILKSGEGEELKFPFDLSRLR